MDKTFEQRIEDAIVARFFEPATGFNSQALYNGAGQVIGTTVAPYSIDAPMTNVAKAIYAEAKDRIMARVLEQINVEAIVEQWLPSITKDVVDHLTQQPGWNAKPNSSQRNIMLNKVYDAVAEEFGKQCVAHLKQTGGLLNVLEGGTSAENSGTT